MALPLPNLNLNDALNNTSSSVGGRISNGMTFNSAGGSIGLVKMLAIMGALLIGLKIWKGGK